VFAVISFLLVFALPQRVGPGPAAAQPEPNQAPPAQMSHQG
jgi:hypothetical protein